MHAFYLFSYSLPGKHQSQLKLRWNHLTKILIKPNKYLQVMCYRKEMKKPESWDSKKWEDNNIWVLSRQLPVLGVNANAVTNYHNSSVSVSVLGLNVFMDKGQVNGNE